MFLRLTAVSGVGPKIAIAILSGPSIGELAMAVSGGDAKRISAIKGVGRKTAEKICVELRDKVDKIGFSQAEILAHGFPYTTISERLLQGATDVEGFCSDYYEYYAAQQGSLCSATISVVDCHRLEEFAVTCKGLFSRYAAAMAGIDPKQVQGYFRKNRHWFYDLKDILEKAGASEADLNTLQQALDEVVTFKASTRRILDSFDVNAHCGLSMYLPADGDQYLDNYYKKFAWNQATGLVK